LSLPTVASDDTLKTISPISFSLPPAVDESINQEQIASGDPEFRIGPRQPQPPQPRSKLLVLHETDDDGMTIAPTTSEVLTPLFTRKLDPRTAKFQSQADKDAFLATLPTAIQLQLNQKFGKDNLKQCFYLQKTGSQAMLLLYKSGFMTNTVKKKLESAFPPARKLRQLMKKYEFVDFRSMQGFQPDWKSQTALSRAQRDMTTACLFHFNLSLPALVRWIAGPHIGEHRDNEEIFACLKPACADKNFQDLVRVFTKGSPTYANAECSQANHRVLSGQPQGISRLRQPLEF
jgi:hypothetical protein